MKKEGGNEGEKVIICSGYNGVVWCGVVMILIIHLTSKNFLVLSLSWDGMRCMYGREYLSYDRGYLSSGRGYVLYSYWFAEIRR